jgi:general stress protein YciG
MPKKKPMTAAEMGRKGGTARAKNLSKEELAAIGRKGAKNRWAKKSKSKKGEN